MKTFNINFAIEDREGFINSLNKLEQIGTISKYEIIEEDEIIEGD